MFNHVPKNSTHLPRQGMQYFWHIFVNFGTSLVLFIPLLTPYKTPYFLRTRNVALYYLKQSNISLTIFI